MCKNKAAPPLSSLGQSLAAVRLMRGLAPAEVERLPLQICSTSTMSHCPGTLHGRAGRAIVPSVMLPTHGRYEYSNITRRPDYTWPGGHRLAVYIALNI